MNKNMVMEEITLHEILGEFLDSYADRGGEINFPEWLGNKLKQEIPDISEQDAKTLTDDIIRAVAEYDKTLQEVKAAIAEGTSKEEWLAENLAQNYADIPAAEAGEKLQQIEESLAVSNMRMMQEEQEVIVETGTVEQIPEEWNEYKLKSKCHEIGRQLAYTAVGVAANVVKDRVENGEDAEAGDSIKGALQGGLIKDSSEMKAVVAGAVKVAAEKGLEGVVPKDTSVDVIGNMAGAAVESAEALCELACGESNVTDTVDKIGTAVTAAGGRMTAGAVKWGLESVPYVGPILVDMAGGLIDHLKGGKFAKDVWQTVRNTAKAAWDGIKNSKTVKAVTWIKEKLFG